MNPRAKEIVDRLLANTTWPEKFASIGMHLGPEDARLLPHVEELLYLRIAEQYPTYKLKRVITVSAMRTYEIAIRYDGIKDVPHRW